MKPDTARYTFRPSFKPVIGELNCQFKFLVQMYFVKKMLKKLRFESSRSKPFCVLYISKDFLMYCACFQQDKCKISSAEAGIFILYIDSSNT